MSATNSRDQIENTPIPVVKLMTINKINKLHVPAESITNKNQKNDKKFDSFDGSVNK